MLELSIERNNQIRILITVRNLLTRQNILINIEI